MQAPTFLASPRFDPSLELLPPALAYTHMLTSYSVDLATLRMCTKSADEVFPTSASFRFLQPALGYLPQPKHSSLASGAAPAGGLLPSRWKGRARSVHRARRI